MSNVDEKKLIGQRATVREHIQKFEKYPEKYDKQFALRSVGIAQNEIRSILSKHRHWNASWEDSWTPPSNWERNCR
jgi:hypothetical protein